ncbi:ROK family protein [Nocardioides donggukensis]|uniref:ROK family protein n=1 Tax=Nocardioides donggukensis TaxID=2774019 RepID=A0A927K313_9ACTN|nr:ROK family protein [Nocardioides donggukensis]MBD8869164.1 ROK family protein [Nocardioides donggukensis]
MADSGVWVGVDVGGSKVLAGVVDDRGRVLRTSRRTTPGRAERVEQVEDTLSAAVLEAADGCDVLGVGVAAAGFVDAAGERVMFAPHLPWLDAPVRARLEHRWRVPVVLDNDANAAAYAEGRFGAAAGVDTSVVVTLGTGIGGALLLDGRIHRGASGMAGEFGHMQVVPDGLPCECGGRGCWEQYSSGNALVRYVRDRLGGRPSALATRCAGDPARVSGPMVTEEAEAGDPLAREAFAHVGDWLGVGLANLVAALDPHLIVVGGGVSTAGDLLLEPARLALRRALVGAGHRGVPPLRPARLGPEAGLVGAATMARESGAAAARPDGRSQPRR